MLWALGWFGFFWVFSKTVPALLTPATAALVVCGGVRKAHQLCVIGNCRRPQQKDQYKNRTTLFLHIIKGNNCTSLLRFYIIYLASPKTNTLYVYSVALTVCVCVRVCAEDVMLMRGLIKCKPFHFTHLRFLSAPRMWLCVCVRECIKH